MSDKTKSQLPPNVAVVGMGYWGKNLVRNFYELGALHTICDSSESVEADCKEKYRNVRFRRDFSEVLSDSDIAAVVLATPALAHYTMAREAILAGKDVFVEKPLAVEVWQGVELAKMAETNSRVLMVGHILQYHPAVLKLRELIQTGSLGQIRYLYSNRLNIGKIRAEENILWSFAPHDISVLLGLLNEFPSRVSSHGAAFLHRHIFDVTMSHFDFPSGVQAHIYVSWLHPFKVQRLVVVGSEKMAVFDDTAEDKLLLYAHRVDWKGRIPTAVKAEAEIVPLPALEPLKEECRHFLDCMVTRRPSTTDAQEGLRVLRVLDACQRSLARRGEAVELEERKATSASYFAHESAHVDEGAEIGAETKIWHFSHIMKGARIGKKCVVGQNVSVDGGAIIGNNVKIQNNVSVYAGVVIEDDVFLGPSCVLTNVTNPRSQINRHSLYERTHLKRGCTIGANATIVCGVTIGRYAFVAAGSVVTTDVPDYGLMIGNPARRAGWMSRHGHRLGQADNDGVSQCPESGYRYKENASGELRCLDLDEEAALPTKFTKGSKSYKELKLNR